GQIRRAECRIALAFSPVASSAGSEGGLAQVRAQRIVRAAREAQDVVREVADFLVRFRAGKGRHRTLTPVYDAHENRLAIAAVDPVVVGQVWRTQLRLAAPIAPMACRAVVDEEHAPDAQRLRVGGDRLYRHAADALAQWRLQLAIGALVAREL